MINGFMARQGLKPDIPAEPYDGMPKGWRRVECEIQEVATNGEWVVFLGIPEEEDDTAEELRHNCDAMGCGSVSGHVLYRFRVEDD
jgi:hypothetical protein